ncbi:MAG: endolytic transglycosylase MltG [Candidatus Nanosynbacter sp.]|nr:endolytic transglycosylase MltG [Candidatus Nanosynbacter sp.]
MKIIGLDVGTVRIGVARADTATKIAIPDGFINVNGQEISEIQRKLRLYNSNILVMGMPRSNNGNQTAQSEFVKQFARQVAATIPGLKIYFQDESLTSVEAERRLKARKNNYQKGEIDAESASIILQDFIERMQVALNNQQSLSPASLGEANNNSDNQNPASNFAKEEEVASSKSSKKQPKKKSFMKKIIIALVILLTVAGLGAFGAYTWYEKQLAAPKNFSCKFNSPAAAATSEGSEENPDCHYQKFEIKTNQTIGDIAENLKKAGLIRSDFAFKTYLKLSSKSAKIKAGTYSLRANLSAKEIVEQMEKGVASSEVFNLTVLPGETLKEIKQKLIKLGYLSEQIDTALLKKYDSPVLKGLYDNEGKLTNPAQPVNVALEGYLYGETYQFYKGETVEHIFETMINQLNSVVVANHIEEKFQKRGFSLREGLILASIIQKEAHSEDMSGVSMVFQNRLKVGMTLGSDVTATYAADLVNPNRDRNDPNNNLRVLETDNLYNTRKHTGLTPGPICSPGITAILAVAEPDENKRSMRYFLTGDDGKMYYSVTDTEHTQKIRDYCQKLCSVGL